MPKKGGGSWSVSGKLTTGSLDNKVQLDQIMEEPTNHTLQFYVKTAQGNTIAIQAEAIILWKVDGQLVSRHVTIGNGTSVSGTAEAVSCTIFDVTPGNTGTQYEVGVQLSRGTRPSIQQPPVLMPIPSNFNVVPSGGILDPSVPIPVDAGAISVFITCAATGAGGPVPIPEGSVTVDQSIASGAARKTYDPRTAEWVPLTPGTTQIVLHNNFAAGTNVLFSVTFGIDG